MFWVVNHHWESFKATKEYCGFKSETERNKISIEDKIVYFGQGIIFGIFETEKLVDYEFKGWKGDYPFQVKLKPIILSERGLLAKIIESKILLQKSKGGSVNLLEITEQEFDQIQKAIEESHKELILI